MGLDYIRKQTGQPWTRRWNKGLDRLKTPTLLDLTISETLRVFTAQVIPGEKVCTGKSYLAERDGESLILCDGLRRIARFTRPPPDTLAKIAAGGGYALAEIQRVGLFGDTVEVQVK